jgi:hypothetical protein
MMLLPAFERQVSDSVGKIGVRVPLHGITAEASTSTLAMRHGTRLGAILMKAMRRVSVGRSTSNFYALKWRTVLLESTTSWITICTRLWKTWPSIGQDGVEVESGCHFAAIPVANRVVDYIENYKISDTEYESFLKDHTTAIDFVESCRRREQDNRLFLRPGRDRGTPM